MLARGVRNVIYNYTDAQRKVRSATSNDAWGPSPALMHEIADLTDNAVAYAEIMPIVWKRLNDHGKNWRHVYKSLVLLDHLIKYGNERVSQQCKENIFTIQTLKDFQHVEDQKDQGYNVREKAKQLVALLKDDERLRNERRKAQEARQRYNRQAMGMDSNGAVSYGRQPPSPMRRNSTEGSDSYGAASYSAGQNSLPYSTANRSTSYNDSLHNVVRKDFVQPASQEEEQLQMQIAIAESQREAEDQERRRRNDDLKVKIALERSVNESGTTASSNGNNSQLFDLNSNSQRLDPSLFDTSLTTASYLPATTASNIGWNPPNNRTSTHLGFSAASNDPWSIGGTSTTTTTASNDPWGGSTTSTAQNNPWSGNQTAVATNDTGLSINISDPWGVGGATNSRSPPPPPVSPPVISKTMDELNDFFGTGAMMTPSYGHQPPPPPHASSNPWNITSTGSTSPSNSSFATGMNGGGLLYPMTTSAVTANPISSSPASASSLSASRKTPESFLGDKFSTLVNLDQLVTEPKSTNPFGVTPARTPNPFTSTTKPPTLEQLSTSNNPTFTSGSTLPPPLIPSSFNNNTTTVSSFTTNNPFM